ncbi:hypothetical protein A9K55_001769 [Cordyceps militaris]|uniref:Uncharacterized protein n=1 Tax=Cordyceps militaris TaxID=73501 RepID=A0A2H4SSF4_CORMI|nr:hypothetical protein A9K55_001769 [Cordyceps militaris]
MSTDPPVLVETCMSLVQPSNHESSFTATGNCRQHLFASRSFAVDTQLPYLRSRLLSARFASAFRISDLVPMRGTYPSVNTTQALHQHVPQHIQSSCGHYHEQGFSPTKRNLAQGPLSPLVHHYPH